MNLYHFVLACHLMSITTWMLMLVYVPKLFVYYALGNESSRDILATQMKSLFKMGTVAMIFSIKFGVIMLYLNSHIMSSGGWIHLKLTLVVGIVVYHLTCNRIIQRLIKIEKPFSIRFLKLFRVIPEIVTTAIIFLTVLKPF